MLPCAVREMLVAFVVAGAGAAPAKALVVGPQPTRSTTARSAAQAAPAQLRRVVELTRATLAPVPLIGIVPVTSGVGNAGSAVFVPRASATRYELCGGIDPVRLVWAPAAQVPAAEAY